MRISLRLISLVKKALIDSMDVRTMKVLVRQFIPHYDIHKRTGIPGNIPIQKRDAANQIIDDINKSGQVFKFINMLVEVHLEGLVGRPLKISGLRAIIREIHEAGFIYNRKYKMFVEDPKVRRTSNWGVLEENEEYNLSFLRIDIVKNTTLVRKYSEKVIRETYKDLRNIVQESIEKRNGRIWHWEGDGGLIAFFFANKTNSSALSAVEIINELHFYNLLKCPMKEPLRIRMAVHCGPCMYKNRIEDIKSDTLKELINIESNHTKPNSVTFSNTVYYTLEEIISEDLRPIKVEGNGTSYYNYQLSFEE